MPVERNASAGYVALKKQVDGLTPITPDVYTPYYKQTLATDISMQEDGPVYGAKFKNFNLLQGQRSHGGSLTVMAEPDTAARWADMLLTRSSTTGANPYTHVFGLSGLTDPNFYTVDISLVSRVERYIGVAASKLAPTFDEDKMVFDLDVSALASFRGREVASVAGNVITLKTDYDPIPTFGLVTGDLVRVNKADGSNVDTTISSLTNTTVTVVSAGSGVANGDMFVLRPATPSLSTKTPFLWPRTEFRFGATAAAALSAAQTRLERGTEVSIEHMFDDDKGSRRSGAFDPASLVRTLGSANFKLKKFLDGSTEVKEFNALTKNALVMRSFSESAGYELRITLNNIKQKTNAAPTEAGGVIFYEMDYGVQFDNTDGQGMSLTVINSVATI